MSTKAKTLNWNDRLAIIDHYKPSDNRICDVFGVSQNELDAARQMRAVGTFIPTTNLDVKSYSSLFSTSPVLPSDKTSTQPAAIKKPIGVPETASPKQKTPKKRGRKGDKIALAFAAIPSAPTDVTEFAAKYSISLAVLRQSKRFDKCPELGNVKVKKDKETGNLMIWREAPSQPTV